MAGKLNDVASVKVTSNPESTPTTAAPKVDPSQEARRDRGGRYIAGPGGKLIRVGD